MIVSVGQTATLDLDTAAAGRDGRGAGARTATSSSSAPGSARRARRRSAPTSPTTRSRTCRRTTATSSISRRSRRASGCCRPSSARRSAAPASASNRDGDSFGGPQVNVFIDGVSLRSNVNQGGIVGQDVSRGNPFSQLAVAEFRVLTSNFKAEYEDAGTSIITAITRSGTNDFHGEIFGTYQDDSLIATDALVAPAPATIRRTIPGAGADPLSIWRRAGRADHPRQPVLLRQLRGQYPGSRQHRHARRHRRPIRRSCRSTSTISSAPSPARSASIWASPS